MKIPFKYSIVISFFFTINPCISQQMKYKFYDSSFNVTENKDIFQIEDSVYRSYKIERVFTPCLLSDSESERIEKEIEKNNRKLIRKYGANWYDQIQHKIDSIEKTLITKKENTFHTLAINNDSLIDISIEINDSGNKIKVVKNEYNSANLSSVLPTLSGPDLKNPSFLYRGIENIIQVDFGQCKQDYTVQCEEGTFDLIQLLSPSELQFAFRVNTSNKNIPISLFSNSAQKTDTFYVQNLPVPSLFANELLLDTVLTKSQIKNGLTFSFDYSNIKLPNLSFEILSWEASFEDQSIIGHGAEISKEALIRLLQFKQNQSIYLSFKIKSNDGIVRKISRHVYIQD